MHNFGAGLFVPEPQVQDRREVLCKRVDLTSLYEDHEVLGGIIININKVCIEVKPSYGFREAALLR